MRLANHGEACPVADSIGQGWEPGIEPEDPGRRERLRISTKLDAWDLAFRETIPSLLETGSLAGADAKTTQNCLVAPAFPRNPR